MAKVTSGSCHGKSWCSWPQLGAASRRPVASVWCRRTGSGDGRGPRGRPGSRRGWSPPWRAAVLLQADCGSTDILGAPLKPGSSGVPERGSHRPTGADFNLRLLRFRLLSHSSFYRNHTSSKKPNTKTSGLLASQGPDRTSHCCASSSDGRVTVCACTSPSDSGQCLPTGGSWHRGHWPLLGTRGTCTSLPISAARC